MSWLLASLVLGQCRRDMCGLLGDDFPVRGISATPSYNHPSLQLQAFPIVHQL